MSHKKRIIILICSVFIYFLILLIYKKINSDLYKEVLVLKKDIQRGTELKLEDFDNVRIKVNNKSLDMKNEFVTSEKLRDCIANKDLTKGNILLKDNVIEKNKYLKNEKEYEIVSLKISNSDDLVSYQLEKNNIINLYYTGKVSYCKEIIDNMNLPTISTKNTTSDIINSDFEYITARLIENVKIIDLYDKYGNVVINKEYNKTESNKIDTMMISVKKDLALKINNLKQYGTFSVSIVK